MSEAEIGVIGGSGLYDMAGLEEVEEVEVETPFGPPSDRLRIGTLAGRRVAFLARHGRGHRLLPGEINYRANLMAMKQLGVGRVISASAVGSLSERIHPLDIVLPDQFFDRTRGRASTFFGGGVVAHVPFGDPVCPSLLRLLGDAGERTGKTIHRGGTYLCMEGPQFSTRAESNAYRAMGCTVIGMTNLPEAKLAREAEICYATIALVTDYDCWHEAESVSVEVVVRRLAANAAAATEMVRAAVAAMPEERGCSCARALDGALLTRPEQVPAEARARLAPILGKYLGPA
jgi:5'-methylthioadenosine phosphorylase